MKVFCKDCGKEMVRLKSNTSWTRNYKCSSCSLRYEYTCADMGGSDAHNFSNKPFSEAKKEEILVSLTK